MGDDDIEDDEVPFVHLIVPAAMRAPPRTRSPSTVFDLGTWTRPLAWKFDRSSRLTESELIALRQTRPRRIVADVGVIRCTTIRVEESEEWQEREAARRARQVLPRPPRSARTMSKKLRIIAAVREDHD